MRVIPRHYQDFVTRVGGRNRYGEPLFRIVWGPDRLETCGGAWQDPDGSTRVEMRSVQKYGPREVFHLEKWCHPSIYGSQADWEYENALKLDGLTPELGIQIIGGFPYRGEYEHSFMLSGRLYFYTLEKLIRLNLQRDSRTPAQRKAARQEQEEKKRTEWKAMVVEMYKDAAPAYYEAVSFPGQKQHTKLLDRVDQIVKQLEHGITGEQAKKVLGLGFKQKPT